MCVCLLLISIWRCPFGLPYFAINVNGPNDCLEEGRRRRSTTKKTIIRKSLSIPSPMLLNALSIDLFVKHGNGCAVPIIMALVDINSVPKIVARKLFNALAKRILNLDICWDLLPVEIIHTVKHTNKQAKRNEYKSNCHSEWHNQIHLHKTKSMRSEWVRERGRAWKKKQNRF